MPSATSDERAEHVATAMQPTSFNLEHSLQLEAHRQLKRAPRHSNARAAIRMSAAVDSAALGCAVNALVARHEILRTAFSKRTDISDNDFVERINRFALNGAVAESLHESSVRPSMPAELVASDRHASEERAEDDVYAACNRPFDLAAPPHLRALLMPSNQGALIVLVVPAPLLDRRSFGVLVTDLLSRYLTRSSQRSNADDGGAGYTAFCLWERAQLANGRYGSSIQAWQEIWRDYAESQINTLDCPLSWPKAMSVRYRVTPTAVSEAAIQPETARLLRHARESGTLQLVILAALAKTIQRFTGKQRFPVWSEFDNHDIPAFAQTVGPLGSAHMIGVTLPFGSSDRALLDQLTTRLRAIADRPQISLGMLHHTLGRSYERGDIRFSASIDNGPSTDLVPDGGIGAVAETPWLKWPMTSGALCDTYLRLTQSGAVLSNAYSTTLFTPDSINRWLQCFSDELARVVRYTDGAVMGEAGPAGHVIGPTIL